MKYRCPYCGEPAFSAAEKMGIPTSFGKFAAFFPTCPHCKRVAHRTSVWRWCSLPLLLLLLVGVTFPLIRWSLTVQSRYVGVLFAASLLLFVGGYVGIYLLFYFGKSSFEAAQDDRFIFSVQAAERLPVRVGDIEVCRFPDRDSYSAPQIIGQVQRIQKQEGGYAVEMRVIRADNIDAPALKERVRVITDSCYDVEGVVSRTYGVPLNDK